MKRFFRLPAIILALLGIVFSSCSNLNESTSLSLTFNGSDFAQSSARNISVSSEYEGMYIVASVLGDYTETKTLQITDNGTYTIEFDSILVGSEIYVRADVYNFESNFIHTYAGTSSKQIISHGVNTINLSMKNLARGISYSDSGIRSFTANSNFFNEEYVSDYFYMYFFPNGKYQIVKNAETSPTVDDVISEGIWQGSFDASGTIYITECVYKTCSCTDSEVTFGKNVIVESPSEIGFHFEFNDGSVGENLTIELLNGLKITYAPY